jgi:hypothetical protein
VARKKPGTPSPGLIPGQPTAAANLRPVWHQVIQAGVPHAKRDAFDITLNVALFHLQLGPALPWIDHTFEVVGTHPPPHTTYERSTLSFAHVPGFGRSYIPHSITVWSRRAYVRDVPNSFAEIRWHPAHGDMTLFAYPSTVPFQEAQAHMAVALSLLQELHRIGAPPGPRAYPSRKSFLADLHAVRQHLADAGISPSQDHVAQHWPFRTSKRQLHRWLDFFHVDWHDLPKHP